MESLVPYEAFYVVGPESVTKRARREKNKSQLFTSAILGSNLIEIITLCRIKCSNLADERDSRLVHG